jgi:hypothetical protein
MRYLALSALVVVASVLGFASAAHGERGLKTGLGDVRYLSAASEGERSALFDETSAAKASVVKLDGNWRAIAGSGRPASPTDPADSAYNFSNLDAAVRDADARGLEPLITIVSAPDWAEGGTRPKGAREGTWRPDPNELAKFAEAVARRYSGTFAPAGTPLPRVRDFEIWNEPNLPVYLTPQYVGKRQVSAELYASMLDKSYAAIKSVHRSNHVVAGATAPYGDPRGGKRTRPLTFLRKLFCLSGKHGAHAKKCHERPGFDVLDHHPITFTEGPRASATNHNDAAMGDLDEVHRVLRSAEREHTIRGPRRHQLWVGEFWWFSNPPGPGGVPVGRHAQWYEQALYEIWRQGGSAAIALQVRDSADPAGLHTGLLYADGTPKPTFTAFRFPFVANASGERVTVWGRAPSGGELRIQRRAGHGWRTIARLRIGAGDVFERRLHLGGKAKLRATVGADRSLAAVAH